MFELSSNETYSSSGAYLSSITLTTIVKMYNSLKSLILGSNIVNNE